MCQIYIQETDLEYIFQIHIYSKYISNIYSIYICINMHIITCMNICILYWYLCVSIQEKALERKFQLSFNLKKHILAFLLVPALQQAWPGTPASTIFTKEKPLPWQFLGNKKKCSWLNAFWEHYSSFLPEIYQVLSLNKYPESHMLRHNFLTLFIPVLHKFKKCLRAGCQLEISWTDCIFINKGRYG